MVAAWAGDQPGGLADNVVVAIERRAGRADLVRDHVRPEDDGNLARVADDAPAKRLGDLMRQGVGADAVAMVKFRRLAGGKDPGQGQGLGVR